MKSKMRQLFNTKLKSESQQIEIEEILNTILPHGSGINYKWEYVFHKNGAITCKNSFQAMNEHGYYDGVMPFKFTLYYSECDIVTFDRIICDENRKVSFYGLKNYLTETIDHCIYSQLGN